MASSSISPIIDWSLLPDGILIDILGRPHTLQYFFAVRGVCHNWRIVASPSPFSLSSQFPLLLLISNSHKSEALYDVATRRLYSLRLPCINSRVTLAYSHSHLITFPYSEPEQVGHRNIIFKNLFTGVETELPDHLEQFRRVIISSRPDWDNCLNCLVVLFKNVVSHDILQYLSVGDTRWNVVISSKVRSFSDMMFFQGELLALTHKLDHGWGMLEVVAVELMGDSLIVRRFGNSGVIKVFNYSDMWLAELEGALLVVIRLNGWGLRDSGKFCIFRWSSEKNEWEEIKDLGDKALFVDINGNTKLISVTGLALRNNCVYSIAYGVGQWSEFSLENTSWKFVEIEEFVEIEDRDVILGGSISKGWVFPCHC